MDRSVYREMVAQNQEKERLESTLAYLTEHLGRMLKQGEKVLICSRRHEKGDLSWLMEQAVLRCGARPVVWGPDRRWKTLLQQAFYSRATTVIGAPLVILGLAKLKKYNGIPLYIRRTITAGYPCLDWVMEGIIKGLDCKTAGCFGLGTSGVVAGFSCEKSHGVHLREDVYGVDIVDENGNPLPEGEVGEMVLYPKDRPDLRFPLGEIARLERAPCPCGCTAPRLLDMSYGSIDDPTLAELGQYLHSWTSVLDCNLVKGPCGLEIEMVVFPGEKLPKLPSAAKQVIRPWDPKHDEPIWFAPKSNISEFPWESD